MNDISDSKDGVPKNKEEQLFNRRRTAVTNGNWDANRKWQQLAGTAEVLLRKLLKEEQEVIEKDSLLEVKKWLILKQEISVGLNHSLSESEGGHSSDWETINEYRDSGTDVEENVKCLKGKQSIFEDTLKMIKVKLFVKTNSLINEKDGSGDVIKICKSSECNSSSSINLDSGFNSMSNSLKSRDLEINVSVHNPITSRNRLEKRKRRTIKERLDTRRRRRQWSILAKNLTTEKLNQEIISLRNEKDSLVDRRTTLEDKRIKTKIWTPDEETEFIQLDETIDVIDTIIELKNCSLLGNNYYHIGKGKIDRILLNKLIKLNEAETFFLLSKYFKGTLTLRHSGYKMDRKINKIERKFDKQNWEIRKIKALIKQENENLERELELLEKQHNEKIQELSKQEERKSGNGERLNLEDVLFLEKERKTKMKVTRLKRKMIIEETMPD